MCGIIEEDQKIKNKKISPLTLHRVESDLTGLIRSLTQHSWEDQIEHGEEDS